MTLAPCSLIIPTRNRPALLADTVASVLQGTVAPAELIVIDQSDAIQGGLEQLPNPAKTVIHHIQSASTGVTRGRNAGMAAAQYELLVLIDDDMRAPADWLGNLIAALVEAGSQSVVTGRVLPEPEQPPDGYVPALVERSQPAIYSGRIGTDVLASCHMAIYRSTFETVGGFDERLGPGMLHPAGDDNDYGYHLLEAGYRIVYAPQAAIIHRAWRSQKEYFRMRWKYGRGQGGFYTKYWSLRDPYMLGRMARDMLLRLVRFPWRVLHRPRLAVGDLVFVAGLIAGSITWLWSYSGRKAHGRNPYLAKAVKSAGGPR